MRDYPYSPGQPEGHNISIIEQSGNIKLDSKELRKLSIFHRIIKRLMKYYLRRYYFRDDPTNNP